MGRTELEDIKDYLQRGMYEEAGIALGTWFNEHFSDELDEMATGDFQELIEGFEGEIS